MPPRKQGSSLEIRVFPFTELPHRSSTPSKVCRPCLRPLGTTRRGHVPSLRSLSVLTAFSERGLRVYCAPQPVMGFAVFQVALGSPPQAGLNSGWPSPTADTPFGVFPSSIAAPRHRGRYLLVVTTPLRSTRQSCKLRRQLLTCGMEPKQLCCLLPASRELASDLCSQLNPDPTSSRPGTWSTAKPDLLRASGWNSGASSVGL